MKEKIPIFALPWCCVVPIAVSFLGVGSATVANALRQFTPLFIALSVGLIGWSNYSVWLGGHRTKRAKIWVGTTTTIALLLWVWSFNRMGLI